MKALAPHTSEIFDQICSLECIKPYFLVGGTALALQIGNRLSEDLDFMSWKSLKSGKLEVDWVTIEKELSGIGKIEARDIWDFDHVEYLVSGVKISFYASPKFSPVTKPVHIKDNLWLADIEAISAMKMEVMLRRSNFRDYYDIYSILQQGINFKEVIALSLNYSGHVLSAKNLLAMLTDSSRFHSDSGFEKLEPKYKVTPIEIESYLKKCIKTQF
ncbi:MAG: nucleotidyl transferase AbiEii/AbiGii toxin family protein [Bacteroidota bacterium]|nr:nucleotidyl transferase AbiEii/AbiGii toxin family protein [Bacteroidota bacterium]